LFLLESMVNNLFADVRVHNEIGGPFLQSLPMSLISVVLMEPIVVLIDVRFLEMKAFLHMKIAAECYLCRCCNFE